MSARPEDSGRQPWLHDLEIAAHGNLTCVADPSGDLDSPGTGLFVDDRRALTRWTLTADGERPVRVSSRSVGATTTVLSVARNLGDEGPDPTIEVHRRRRLVDGGLREQVVVVSRWDRPLTCRLRLSAAGDAAELMAVKAASVIVLKLAVTADGDTVEDTIAITVRGTNKAPVVDAGADLPPVNALSTHYFISRVLYPAVTQAEIRYNTEFVRFFDFLPPRGAYSPIEVHFLRRR